MKKFFVHMDFRLVCEIEVTTETGEEAIELAKENIYLEGCNGVEIGNCDYYYNFIEITGNEDCE